MKVNECVNEQTMDELTPLSSEKKKHHCLCNRLLVHFGECHWYFLHSFDEAHDAVDFTAILRTKKTNSTQID